MESTSLFNPGFLGSSFNWWIGQIPDDSYWRDNITPTKFEGPDGTTGWGYRYKVRILGLHDRDEETIPSDQLPWAQVMYPVTAGGGQAASFQTPNIRQGNFVFGFFLDGSDMQVPVIMGVLGNNAKTNLKKTVTNFEGASGYQKNAVEKASPVKPPDRDLSIVQGERAEIEASNQVHRVNAGEVIREELLCEKIPLATPENAVQSAMKNMQTEIENLTSKISKYLNSITSYADAVSFRGQNPQILIKDASKVMAKYTKPIMDQMMAHSQKVLNAELTKVVSALPSSERYLFSEMKEEMNEMALCLYNKLTNNLSNKIEGLLLDALDIDNLIAQARGNRSDGKENPFGDGNIPKTPDVPMCAAEQIVADVIISNIEEIQENNDTMIEGVNEFLKDITDKVSGVLGIVDQISDGLGIIGALSQLGNIKTSMAAAMLFNNLSVDVFGCELKPNEAVSDEYMLCSGGSGKPDSNLPSEEALDEKTGTSDGGAPKTPDPKGFAQPGTGTRDVGTETTTPPSEEVKNAITVDESPSEQGGQGGLPLGSTTIRDGGARQRGGTAVSNNESSVRNRRRRGAGVRSRDPVPPVQTDQQISTAQGPPVPSSDSTTIRSEAQVQSRFGQVSVTGQKVTVNGVRLSPQESVAYYQEQLRAQRAQLNEMKAGAAAPGRDEVFRSAAQTFIDDLELQIRANEEALRNEQRRGQ